MSNKAMRNLLPMPPSTLCVCPYVYHISTCYAFFSFFFLIATQGSYNHLNTGSNAILFSSDNRSTCYQQYFLRQKAHFFWLCGISSANVELVRFNWLQAMGRAGGNTVSTFRAVYLRAYIISLYSNYQQHWSKSFENLNICSLISTQLWSISTLIHFVSEENINLKSLLKFHRSTHTSTTTNIYEWFYTSNTCWHCLFSENLD